jgi:hypothetical protein
MDAGDYREAGEAFLRLAETSETGGRGRALHFYLQSAMAFIRAGETARGMELAKKGLAWLGEAETQLRGRRACRRFQQDLYALGMEQEALDFAGWAAGNPAGVPRTDVQKDPEIPSRVFLPLSCPACSAPLRPDEVGWVDSITVECAFCTSLVRGEIQQ